MKTFSESVKLADFAGLHCGSVMLRGFDPTAIFAPDRLRMTVSIEGAEINFKPTPAEAIALAEALLDAADTFDGHGEGVFVRYVVGAIRHEATRYESQRAIAVGSPMNSEDDTALGSTFDDAPIERTFMPAFPVPALPVSDDEWIERARIAAGIPISAS